MADTIVERDTSNLGQNTWPLEDILEFSQEARNNSGEVKARTATPHIKDNFVTTQFGKDGTTISFQTDTPNFFIAAIEKKIGPNPEIDNKKFDRNPDSEKLNIESLDVAVDINQDASQEKLHTVSLRFNRFATPSTSLRQIGLESLLKNTDIPDILTPEYAAKLITEGHVAVGDRDIPVRVANDMSELRTQLLQNSENKINVYHGTSLTNALSIAQRGFFSERPDHVRPVLSARPNVMSLKLAKDEWGSYRRTDPSEYGAVIVFKAGRDEVVSKGNITDSNGNTEEIFQPTLVLTDANETYRLRRKLKVNAGGSNPGYLPPDDVAEIILVKQTKQA